MAGRISGTSKFLVWNETVEQLMRDGIMNKMNFASLTVPPGGFDPQHSGGRHRSVHCQGTVVSFQWRH